MQVLRSNSALFGAPEKARENARVRWRILEFFRALGVGDPRECRGYVEIPPSFGPLRGDV